jgi:hypothetical protein
MSVFMLLLIIGATAQLAVLVAVFWAFKLLVRDLG